MWRSFLRLIPNLLIALALLIAFALLARLASRVAKSLATRARLRASLVDLIGQLIYLAMYILGILVALTVIFPSITPGSLIAGLGLTSLALGFAFKDIVENFIAGVLILWRFPIEIGDYIEVGEIEGKVERINIRMTEIRHVNGDLILVPNAKLFTEPVTNDTNWADKRVTVICGVAYGEDVATARGIIEAAVKACETVRRSAARPGPDLRPGVRRQRDQLRGDVVDRQQARRDPQVQGRGRHGGQEGPGRPRHRDPVPVPHAHVQGAAFAQPQRRRGVMDGSCGPADRSSSGRDAPGTAVRRTAATGRVRAFTRRATPATVPA